MKMILSSCDFINENSKNVILKYINKELSIRLTNKFGKGFSIPNLKRMRQFYNRFPIGSTLLNQLTWSHYLELIKIDDIDKRNFYMHECINSNWDVRELQRQIKWV